MTDGGPGHVHRRRRARDRRAARAARDARRHRGGGQRHLGPGEAPVGGHGARRADLAGRGPHGRELHARLHRRRRPWGLHVGHGPPRRARHVPRRARGRCREAARAGDDPVAAEARRGDAAHGPAVALVAVAILAAVGPEGPGRLPRAAPLRAGGGGRPGRRRVGRGVRGRGRRGPGARRHAGRHECWQRVALGRFAGDDLRADAGGAAVLDAHLLRVALQRRRRPQRRRAHHAVGLRSGRGIGRRGVRGRDDVLARRGPLHLHLAPAAAAVVELRDARSGRDSRRARRALHTQHA
mmetsp:Transcript_92947/g.284504  ORF Transcript_92947/g.284504 Transcript_92947/m.284504 type:complete len:296 (-) Transcript_92947:89-976(-)